MLLTILAAAATGLASAPAAPAPTDMNSFRDQADAGKCERSVFRHADGKQALRPRRFTELPPGRLELAVYREVAGCPIPAVVREEFGARPLPAQ